MALRQGQREVRIEEAYIRAALKDQPHASFINLDEKIVGASMRDTGASGPYADPPMVVFLVEKVDAEEG